NPHEYPAILSKGSVIAPDLVLTKFELKRLFKTERARAAFGVKSCFMAGRVSLKMNPAVLSAKVRIFRKYLQKSVRIPKYFW
ncbi:MAG: hypothetical protein ACI4NA_01845, partial [Succinivibrio sp.]